MKRVALNRDQLERFLRRNWFAMAIVSGALVAAGVGYLMGDKRFSIEREQALAAMENDRGLINEATNAQKQRPQLDERMRALSDQMLGPSLESVDSEVRRRLNRACEELGINDFSVTTGTSVGRPTPAKKEFKRLQDRKLRDEIDFTEVQATVLATAPVDRIYRLIFRVDAEPWIKRIESLRLDPRVDGNQLRLTMRLTTPFMPGQAPRKPLVIDPERLKASDRYAALFAANPFRIPPPPTPAPPTAVATAPTATPPTTPQANSNAKTTPAPVPTPPGGFPYGEWQITGVVDGPGGPEAWLRHLPTGTSLALQPGNAVGELTFRRVEYDFAVFDGPSGACRIQVGTNLTQRASVAG